MGQNHRSVARTAGPRHKAARAARACPRGCGRRGTPPTRKPNRDPRRRLSFMDVNAEKVYLDAAAGLGLL